MLDGQRIGIVLLSAIGDVVHALPLTASLRAAAPNARIEWIVQAVPGEILTHHPAIDRVLIVDRQRGWRGFREFRATIGSEPFDLVLDLQFYAKASIVTALMRSHRRIGFDRRRARELNWLVNSERIPCRRPQHVCEQYLEFADYLGIPRRYTWDLPLSASERQDQAAFYSTRERPVAALVIGTSRREKEWPADRWAALADTLHADLGYDVLLVGSDNDRAERVIDATRTPAENQHRHDLRRLIWLLDGAALVVSPDTGPYHVAVALDVPTIGLFGATDPIRNGPNRRVLDLVVDAFHRPGASWGEPSLGIREGRMAEIGTATVLEVVERARERYPRARYGPVVDDDTPEA